MSLAEKMAYLSGVAAKAVKKPEVKPVEVEQKKEEEIKEPAKVVEKSRTRR